MSQPPKTPHSLSDSLKQLVQKGVDEIDTPSLVVDLDAMTRNLTRMAEFAKKNEIRWRPHAKMHKSSELAKQLMKAGAIGVCVQKTAEAEAMAAGGVRDIYISNEVIAPHKLARVAQLAQRLAAENGKLAIAVDSTEGIERLANAINEARARHKEPARIDVFVEIGRGRCGVLPGADAVPLVHVIRKHAVLRFAGLQAYAGGAQHLRSPKERRDAIAAMVQDVVHTRQRIEAEGIAVELVTGAGTGTMVCEAASGVYGELQAGSFLFMDVDYAANEQDPAQPRFEHALFIKSQVICSHANRAVCDAGHKSHAIDSGLPKVLPLNDGSEVEYFNGGDEHGILKPRDPQQRLPKLGETVWLIPGHCDPTVNLHNHIIGVAGGLRSGRVEKIIEVDARGALT
jgi:D-serine deaminase-like pyridoxal phosphate-dependent protein